MSRKQRQTTGLEIAVIGMAGRFPGARDVEQFWTLLREGVQPISRFSDADLLANGADPAQLSRPDFVRLGFMLDDIDLFDASFFGYTPREAEIIDPQQRFYLECAVEVFERAGYDPETYPGNIGVFAGASFSSYFVNNILANPDAVRQLGSVQVALGNDKDYVATRVAYKLNLQGPAVTVQSACSTSLVAVHLACQSLLAGDCDMALAGGVSIQSRQKTGYVYQEGGIASRDGHCRPFDAAASGTVGSAGVGIVVLKRLADALADNDTIDAVILGSAINNDGSRKIGFTAPRVEGQAQAIQAAQRMAGVSPAEISYIETHGTGTQLGDPIEIAALTRVFRASTDRTGFCPIGSLKSNIGHADAAAGVAGLMKTVLALKHRAIPPSLNFERPNPQIDFANSPFYVNTALREWTTGGAPRRAGVSSFGLGGTNAHVVLEEAPACDSPPEPPADQLIVLSAKTDTALQTMAQHLAAHLRQHPESRLCDVAWTLQTGRKIHPHRLALVCSGPDDAARALESRDPLRVLQASDASESRGVVFMFSGQGAQYPGMTRDLYARHDTFRREVDRCCDLLRPHLGLDLRSLLYPDAAQTEQAAQQLMQTAMAQAALFTVEYALARMWLSWGVVPQAMIGHSVGEYVAACIAEVMSLEDAARVIAARGRLMQAQPAGAMLSVPLSPARLAELLPATLEVAAVNAPSLCVVSGPTAEIEVFERRLAESGHACRRLHTSHAFHSAMMEPAAQAFAALVGELHLAPPRIPFVSNLTGTWITGSEATDPAYWARHLRHTVRFSAGVATLLEQPGRCFLEVGPGNTLTTFVQQHLGRDATRLACSCVRHPRHAASDTAFLLDALARLWLAGVCPDWRACHGGQAPRRVPLPAYPFERRRYWLQPSAPATRDAPSGAVRKNADVSQWLYAPAWRSTSLPDPDGAPACHGRWLVFCDAAGLGERIAANVVRHGGEAIRVTAGGRFERRASGDYVIDIGSAEDYRRLLDAACTDVPPDRIVHAFAVGGDEAEGADLERAFYSPLFLVQAMARRWAAPRTRLDVLADGVHAVTGEEMLRPEKAAALGICRVLPQELPGVSWSHLDIERWDPGAPDAERLAHRVTAHLARRGPESVVAWRGRRGWIQDFERVPRLDATRPIRLRERGVYLITGGLGGVGMILAERFAGQAQARLVLTGRGAFPPPTAWDEWLAGHDDDPISRKIRRLRAMEAKGAEVTVRRADVADREQMAQLATEMCERFGQVHGIVHAAGVVTGASFALLPDLARAECERQFRAKLRGLRLLAELFADESLDFVLTTSSLATVLGGVGMAAYAAANLAMDALCHDRHRAGHDQWLGVDWDAWRLQDDAAPATSEASMAALAITAQEGTTALDLVLRAGRLPQIVVSTADLGARIRQWTQPAAVTATAPAAPPRERPQPVLAPELARNETERAIAEIWQESFGIEHIGPRDGFFDLGGHSLMALQIVARIRDRFGADLSLARFLELATVERVAADVEALAAADTVVESRRSAGAGERDEISL